MASTNETPIHEYHEKTRQYIKAMGKPTDTMTGTGGTVGDYNKVVDAKNALSKAQDFSDSVAKQASQGK